MKTSIKNFSLGIISLLMMFPMVQLQAQYTRNMYDKNGRKVLTFSMPRAMTTECSTPQEVKNALKHETAFYDRLFSGACESHDYGWSAAPWQKAGFPGLEGKRIADERFRVDMQRACDARFKSAFEAPRKAACYAAAEIYFAAVYHKVDAGWQKKQTDFTRDPNKKVIYSSKRPAATRGTTKVTASKYSVWGVNSADKIYFWNGGDSWTNVPGGLKDVSIGTDGTVWGVNKVDAIYKRQNNQWVKVPGALKQISVGKNTEVWGVNKANHIFKRVGNSWKQIPGFMKHVDAASDGTVWGVNPDGSIYRWNGRNWTKMPGVLKMVSVGSSRHIWGVNPAGYVFQWTGSRWVQKPGKLKNVDVAADGTVWGVNSSDMIYKWNGSKWVQTKGRLKDLAVRRR